MELRSESQGFAAKDTGLDRPAGAAPAWKPYATAAAAPDEAIETVPALLASRVSASPDALAYAYEAKGVWRSVTWDEFGRRASRIAAGLVQQGLRPGDHIGMLAPTSLAWELLHHAILLAGGVVVGLEPHDVSERLQWIADHADLCGVVAGNPELLAKLSPEQLSRYRLVVMIEWTSSSAPVAKTAFDWGELEAEPNDSIVLPDVHAEDPATLIYTSGTTGEPKGILYRHGQVTLAVQAINRAYSSVSVGARFVCWLPLSNLFQRIMNLAALRVGGTTFLVPNPLDVLKALPYARPTVFIGVPRFYEKLYEGIQQEIARKPRWMQRIIRAGLHLGARAARERKEGLEPALSYRLADRLVLRKLRGIMGGEMQFMIIGSAPIAPRLLEFFDSIGLPLLEAYGLSENVLPMALSRPGEYRYGCVGKALPENSVRVESDGELLVKGPGVFSGYYKEAMSRSFTADGFYCTGDFASVASDGFIKLEGRKSEIIKTSTGRRISPHPIEAALGCIPGVSRAVVVGAGRKCLVGILFTSSEGLLHGMCHGSSMGDGRLRVELAKATEALALHERPAGYLLSSHQLSVEAGDLTANLKLRRSTIEARYQERIDALYSNIEKSDGRELLVRFDPAE